MEYKDSILGYIFGFLGSLIMTEQALTALGLGFIGALGGWLFGKLEKKITNYYGRNKKIPPKGS